MEHHCFSEECDDVPVHFQLLLLAQQVYIWVALGAPRLGNLTLAMPTRLVGVGRVAVADHCPACTYITEPTQQAHGACRFLVDRLHRIAMQDATPAATALLRGSAEGESMSMAQRIGGSAGGSYLQQ